MKTKHLSDETLDFTLTQKIQSEREILTDILHLLRESERRRLFSKYGFSSLLEYACKRHVYSEDQANRRITAMRLLRDLPEIEEKIESGMLTLTHLCKAQAVFRAEKKADLERTTDQKLELLAKIEKAPTREAEKTLEREAFVLLPKKSRELALEQFSDEVQVKLMRLMDVLAHSGSQMDVNTLVGKLADLGLEKWDPIRKARRADERAAKVKSAEKCETGDDVPAAPQVKDKARPRIPSAIRHSIFLRDNSQCTNCKSSRMLEVDHIIPFAKGGETELSNLRLLCRACNQRHAIDSYGLSQMSSYLGQPSLVYLV